MPDIILPGPAGRIEARYQRQKAPNAPMALILHSHPQYGGTMNKPLLFEIYYPFHQLGWSVGAVQLPWRGPQPGLVRQWRRRAFGRRRRARLDEHPLSKPLLLLGGRDFL